MFFWIAGSTVAGCNTLAPKYASSAASSKLMTLMRCASGQILGSVVRIPSTSVQISMRSEFSPPTPESVRMRIASRSSASGVGGENSVHVGPDFDALGPEAGTDDRGGKIRSTAIIGTGLGAERIEIWTDVDGI